MKNAAQLLFFSVDECDILLFLRPRPNLTEGSSRDWTRPVVLKQSNDAMEQEEEGHWLKDVIKIGKNLDFILFLLKKKPHKYYYCYHECRQQKNCLCMVIEFVI